jgi:hypothetical protein
MLVNASSNISVTAALDDRFGLAPAITGLAAITAVDLTKAEITPAI